MKKLIITLIICIFSINFIGVVSAQEISPQPDSKEVELIKSEYQNLKDQNKSLMQSVEREREQYYKFIEGTYAQIRNVLLIVIAILGFLGWKTFKEIKEDAKNLAQDSYRKTIRDNSTGLSDSLQKINLIVDRETIFKSKKIGFIYKSAKKVDIDEITGILNDREFKNVSSMEVSNKTDSNNLNANTFDVLVYFLKDFKEEKKIIQAKVIAAIKGTSKPLIIYTNHDNAILKKDVDELINIHKWILLSNNRISLLNSIFSVSNLFS